MKKNPADNRSSIVPVSRGRRAFLRGISGSGLVVGSLLVGADAVADEPRGVESEEGYRENGHIRRYYELSRF
ncbi:MAG TPA: hypothetical protein VIN77_13285 [Aurantimonas sp.]|uniref:Formate dehydrogenase n=1 Tax=Aurantimonas marianensis TaxID=2920428 RepID=A0A9X2KEA6_9HYPH|nr:hypothetical protein [Aurantimonas marianensis]MCP3055238.1 hypothetical protein [Aurantimonas marianensis]